MYGRDIRDLWRYDEHGRRRLTLRMIYVRVLHLPATSALAIDANGGKMPWSLTDHLLADLWYLDAKQLAGRKAPKDHPGRPKAKRHVDNSPERQARLRAARRKRAALRAKREGG